MGQWSAKFDFDVFGMNPAKVLAVEFAHKCTYYYALWLAREDDHYAFTETDHADYVESADFRDLHDT